MTGSTQHERAELDHFLVFGRKDPGTRGGGRFERSHRGGKDPKGICQEIEVNGDHSKPPLSFVKRHFCHEVDDMIPVLLDAIEEKA